MAARAALALEGGGGSGVPAHELNIGQKYVTGRFVGGGGSHARWLCLLWVTRVSPTEICFARDGSLAHIGGGPSAGADSCRSTGSSANSRSRAATPGGSASPAEVVARRAARQAAAEKREAEEKQRRAQKEAAAVVAAAPTAVGPRASPKRRRHLAGLAALAASLQSNQQHSTS
eukprot:COSAG01_NODE_8613_length_2719_cov_59.627863_1_plen_174_part_00